MNASQTLSHLLSTLAPVGVSHWEKHGMSRLYINVALAYEEANLPVPSDTDGVRFYLDLKAMKWHVTGKQKSLIRALNELADLPALTEQYAEQEAVSKAKSAKKSDLMEKSDEELITLIRNGVRDEHNNYVWADKISRVPGISVEVINTIMAVDGYWFQNEALLGQKNFPADAWRKACEPDTYNHAVVDRLVRTSNDPEILDLIATNSHSSWALEAVDMNRATRFRTLLTVASKIGISERVLTHPEMTDELLAPLVADIGSEWEAYKIGRHLKSPGPKTLKVLESITDPKFRKELAAEADFLTPECLDSWVYNANSALAIAILRNPNTSDETVFKCLDDDRVSVNAAAVQTLQRRGYVARWVKE